MDTVTKERYLRQLNYKNRMKLQEEEEEEKAFQKEEEKAFQMIPERPKSFGIKTENVNYDKEDYLRLDKYVTILETASNKMEKSVDENNQSLPCVETASNEPSYSKATKSSSSKTEKEMAASANGSAINILPSYNIYDGDRGKNNEHNILQKFNLHINEPLNHSSRLKDNGEDQNTFKMWQLKKMAEETIYDIEEETGIDVSDASVCEQAESDEASKGGLTKSIINEQGEPSIVSKPITIVPCIYERLVDTGLNIDLSICHQRELTDISKGGLIKSNSVISLPVFFERVTETRINTTDVAISDQPAMPDTSNMGVITGKESRDQPESPETSNMELIRRKEITEQPKLLPETSNVDVLRCKVRSKHILIVIFSCLVVITAIAFMVYYSTLSDTDNTRENVTASNDNNDDDATPDDDIVTTDDMTVTTYYVPDTSYDAPATTYDVPATTYDVTMEYVAVTINDAICINFRANCNTYMEKKITDNTIGRNKLIIAAINGNITQVCDLLKCGASVNSHDRRGVTPLHAAARKGHVDVIKLLLAYKAPVDKADPHGGRTPLYEAARSGHVNATQLLLTYKASVDKAASPSKGGRTPLHVAAKNGHVHVVYLLLTYNASVDKSDSYGWTPLHAAVYNDKEATVELLCNAGADVNAQTHKSYSKYRIGNIAAGSTPLHIAVIKRNTIIVNKLMFHKAELLKDKKGFTAFTISIQQNTQDITAELRTNFYMSISKRNYNNPYRNNYSY